MAKYDKQERKKHDAELRARLKILKSKKLYSGDLRKPLTKYARAKAQSSEFAAVIAGTAQVRSAPSRTEAAKYSGLFKTHGRKVIIPPSYTAPVRYSTKQKAFVTEGRTLPKAPAHKKPRAGETVIYTVVIVSKDGLTQNDVFVTDVLSEVEAWLGAYNKVVDNQIYVRTDIS